MDAIIGRIERAVNKLDKSGGGDDGGVAPSLAAHQEFYKAAVDPFIAATNKFPELKSIAEWTKTVFDFEAVVIEASTVCAKPDDTKLAKFLAPLLKVQEAASKPDNRSPFFNHFKAFHEFIQASNWVTVPGPKDFILGQVEAAQLYSNRVLTAAKDKPDPEKTNHRDYVNTLKALGTKLADYADDFFKSGLIWKFGGADVDSFKPGQKPAAGGDKKVTAESRLESVAARLEKLASKGEAKEGGKHPAIAGYEEFLSANLPPFLATCGHFTELKQIGEWAKTAFEFQGKAIQAITVSSKPSDSDFLKFLDPIVKIISASEKTDKSEFFPHQKAFNECVQGLGWFMQPGPKAAITAQVEASEMYNNKILVLAKNKTGDVQQHHRDYVKNLKALFTNLADYANEHFKMGVTWKAGGPALSAFKA